MKQALVIVNFGTSVPMGYERVIVQPTHLLYGIEYDKIRSAVLPYAGQFETLLLGKPLLSGTDDLIFLAKCLKEAFAPGAVHRIAPISQSSE